MVEPNVSSKSKPRPNLKITPNKNTSAKKKKSREVDVKQQELKGLYPNKGPLTRSSSKEKFIQRNTKVDEPNKLLDSYDSVKDNFYKLGDKKGQLRMTLL
ncbi:hypothetical protein S245_044189 [Arachis hypogaea]